MLYVIDRAGPGNNTLPPKYATEYIRLACNDRLFWPFFGGGGA